LKDLAIESGVIENSKPGWFIRKHIPNDNPVKEENIYTTDFWLPIFKQTDFGNFLTGKFQYTSEFDIVTDEEKLETISERETFDNPILLNETETETDTTNGKGKKGKK